MVLIKSYRVEGFGHSGAPYTMDMDFTEIQAGNQCHFDKEKGIPLAVAEGLINAWNRTIKMYGNSTVYSIILPAHENPGALQSTSTEIFSSRNATVAGIFELIGRGVCSLPEFEEWCMAFHAEATKEGYNDGISEAKAMIDSLLQE